MSPTPPSSESPVQITTRTGVTLDRLLPSSSNSDTIRPINCHAATRRKRMLLLSNSTTPQLLLLNEPQLLPLLSYHKIITLRDEAVSSISWPRITRCLTTELQL